MRAYLHAKSAVLSQAYCRYGREAIVFHAGVVVELFSKNLYWMGHSDRATGRFV